MFVIQFKEKFWTSKSDLIITLGAAEHYFIFISELLDNNIENSFLALINPKIYLSLPKNTKI